MRAAAIFKRNVVKEAVTGNVINITPDEEIESIKMRNLDRPHTLARSNILKNIATAADMPAKLLDQESFVEGFGEGTEDSKNLARYIDRIRIRMEPMYRWFEEICMYRAWSPAFYEVMQKDYPELYADLDYKVVFYRWKRSFTSLWPNLLKEPESKLVEIDDVRLKAAIAIFQIFYSILDIENQITLVDWMTDVVSQNRLLFTSSLTFDLATFKPYLESRAKEYAELIRKGADPDSKEMESFKVSTGRLPERSIKVSRTDSLDEAKTAILKVLAGGQ
jgi:hypothetical protein